jgi:regulator of protease activity HflC (stomatin/prohibitin superfamily)
MERNVSKLGLTNVVLLLAAGVVFIILSRYTKSLSGQVGALFFGLGFLVSLVSYFQMRLEDKERLEQLDFDEIQKSRGDSSLFETPDAETFPARRSREQFERFFLPGFTIVLLIAEAIAAYYTWGALGRVIVVSPVQPMVALSIYGVLALTLFLIGKYSANLAELNKDRLQRPGASFLVFGAYLSFAVAIGISFVLGGVAMADVWLARGWSVLLGLLAVESLLNLILEIYRPRTKGKVPRLVYESRLIGLLAHPEGIFTTAAQALDYQFGFKVSETWFYRFLEKALAWLLLLQFAVLIISSCFIFVGPGEQALLERFGKPVAGGTALEPGPHLKMPWPIDRVFRFRTQEIQSFNIGYVPDDKKAHDEKTILWTVAHEKEEFNLLIASKNNEAPAANGSTNSAVMEQAAPVDLLTVGIPIQYQIKDVRAWAYNYMDAGELLQKISMREVIKYLMSVDLFGVMSSGRAQASADLQKLIQERADQLNLGVQIVLVGFEDIHPPVKVAPEFEKVVGVQQENEAKLREAEGYSSALRSRATAESSKLITDAESFKIQRVSSSAALAGQFTNQVAAYSAAPAVFKQRAYLNALSAGAAKSRKYVLITTNSQGIINLNLEDKIRELGDIEVPAPRK